MKKTVVDTSVIIAVIAEEPQKKALIALTKGSKLIAPHSVHWEVANAFSAMLRRQRITPDEALKALGVYVKIPIRFLDVELDLSLKLAGELGIYAYDAYILRCCQRYEAPLLSLDRYLLECAKRLGIHRLEVR